ncbi:head-tail adaptor protein [Eubacteriales bacterium OttesenSCG-928-A19]|nr:head-tail adaptor protein [Eubacteriales bacterium OttesenSCG-928-A19]
MAYGKMNTFIDLLAIDHIKDVDGFSKTVESVVASVRAYKEDRHGSVGWANRAAFSSATAMFRLRIIPGLTVDASHIIVCGDGRYRISSVEDVEGRGMYLEILAEKEEPTMR